MESKNLAGALKAAILIQAMDRGAAEEILSTLAPEERSLIEGHLSQMGPVAPDVLEKVAAEFMQSVDRRSSRRSARGAGQREKEPEGEAGSESPEPAGLKILQNKDPQDLANLIKVEHPQTIAFVLVHMEPKRAGEVLMKLPDKLKAETAYRIATSTKFSSEMVEEMRLAFEDILKKERTAAIVESGGVQRLADILNVMENTVSQTIMGELEPDNPNLVAQIRQMMFVFDDITLVDDKGFQQVLRRIDSKDLAVALKASSEEIKEKVFKNMSSRAGTMLREEMDSLGPVRMRDVEASQQAILNIIVEMEAKGELVIRRGGGDEFVE